MTIAAIIAVVLPLSAAPVISQELKEDKELDERVEKFLESHKLQWGI